MGVIRRMHWENHPFVLLLLALAAASVVFAFIMGNRRRSPGAVPLVVLSLAAGVWQAGYALELLADGQPNKVFWAQTQYPGIAVIPTAWLAVALQYSGRGSQLPRRNLALLSIMPLATVAMAWTNGAHGLIWSEITVDAGSSLTVLLLDHGAFFWVNVLYSYVILYGGNRLGHRGPFPIGAAILGPGGGVDRSGSDSLDGKLVVAWGWIWPTRTST